MVGSLDYNHQNLKQEREGEIKKERGRKEGKRKERKEKERQKKRRKT